MKINFKEIESFLENDDYDLLKGLYKNFFSKESMLFKYKLIEISEECELMVFDPPRIFDKRINKTLIISSIPITLLKELIVLITNQYIEKFAIRVNNVASQIYDGRFIKQKLVEELETGKYFSIKDVPNIPLTKLCSANYEDLLWIVVDETNITFEEISQSDYKIGEYILTQVVHLQYQRNSSSTIITHLDHEYIFYTEEEYNNRKNNKNRRGLKKLKSFMINDARIPFEYNIIHNFINYEFNDCQEKEVEEKVPLLIYVLKSYFKNHKLIDEYFQEISK